MLRPLTEALARRNERRSNRMYFLFTMAENPRSVLKERPMRGKRNLVLGRDHGTTKGCKRLGGHRLVEPDGIEPTTSCLQSTRSPN